MFFGKIPSLASGTSLLSFSLFLGHLLKFHTVRTFADEEFCQLFFPSMVLFFPRYSLDVAWT